MSVSGAWLGVSRGSDLGVNLGTPLGGIVPLLRWSNMTFANASPRYIWDASGKVLHGVYAGGTAAIATIDGKRRYQSEGARTNLVNEVFEDFTTAGSPTLTAGQPDPLGGTSAMKLEGLTTADYILDGSDLGVPDGPAAPSWFQNQIDTTGTMSVKSAASQSLGDLDIDAAVMGAGWQRMHDQHLGTAIDSGRVFVISAGGGGGLWGRGIATFEDMYLWAPQWEDGTFPSSRMDISTTRAADAGSFAAGQVPQRIRSGRWSTELTPMHASVDVLSAAVHYIFYTDASNYLSLTEDGGGNVQAKLATTGGNLVKTITYSRDQVVTLTPDFAAGSLTVAGATTGDGTVGGTVGDWPSGTLHALVNASAGDQLFGTASEPEAA